MDSQVSNVLCDYFIEEMSEDAVVIEPHRNSVGDGIPHYSHPSGAIDRALSWMSRVMTTSDNEEATIQSFVNFLHSKLLSDLDLDLQEPLQSLCRTFQHESKAEWKLWNLIIRYLRPDRLIVEDGHYALSGYFTGGG